MSENSKFLDLVLKGSKIISSLVKRRLLLLRYFESVYVRSTYNIVNQFIFKGEKMTGKDTSQFFSLVFKFLNSIQIFYNSILYIDTLEDISTVELSLFESEKFDLYQLECIYLVFPSDFKINVGINKENFKNYLCNLSNDINNLNHHIKYFEVDKIIEIFNKNLKEILICDDILENNLLKIKKYEEIADSSAETHEDDSVIDILNKNFQKSISKCKEKDRSLNRQINVAHNELFEDNAIGLYEYVFKKTMNDLTRANFFYKKRADIGEDKDLNVYNDENYLCKIENFEIESGFILQNLHYFIDLNNLISSDFETGQKIFYDILYNSRPGSESSILKTSGKKVIKENSFVQFLRYVFRFNIFSVVVYECSKVYQIDQITKSNMLCFNLAQECIKF
jgi:hypothetical protein